MCGGRWRPFQAGKNLIHSTMSNDSKQASQAKSYRDTLNLPDTPFPMRGELPKREPGWITS